MPASPQLMSRRIWVDLALTAIGAAFAMRGLPLVGVPLLVFALVAPVLRLRQNKRGSALLSLVPVELADAHRSLVAAAALPGVLDGQMAVAAADDVLLETAALLVGRPPRGRAQERFVAARVAAINATAVLLRERHDAVTAAMKELDAMAPVDVEAIAPADEPHSGVAVRVFALLLIPAFLLWDIVGMCIKALVAFVEGVLLRVRATGRLMIAAARALLSLTGQAHALWRATRSGVIAAARDARRSTTSLRLRTQLEARRLRHRFRMTH